MAFERRSEKPMLTVLNDGEATMPKGGAMQLLPEHRDRVQKAFLDLENKSAS